jgi:raffinose synthase
LESFAAGGVQPKLLILDDGWLSKRALPTGNEVLTSFKANEKFPGDLAPTVQMAKGEFGIETFLVWHAMVGYWGGVSDEELPGYDARATKRRSSPGVLHHVRLTMTGGAASRISFRRNIFIVSSTTFIVTFVDRAWTA